MNRVAAFLRETSSVWFAEDLPNWVFAAKTTVAGLLALWISFRLDFAQPQWALMTVYIVARKESGLVMTKGFFRIVGTVVGCGMSLLLAAWFSQTAELFLLALAAWIGLCVALAARYRNFQSYGFMLAGYTAAIVGFGAAAAPSHAFDIAQARVSEVVLGILCAGVVAETFFPVHGGKRVVPEARARFSRFSDFMVHAFSLEIDTRHMQEIQQGFLADVVGSETQRSSSFLESPDTRLRDAHQRWMNAAFMRLSTTFHVYIQAMRRFRDQAAPEVQVIITNHYQEIVACLDDASTRTPEAVATHLSAYRQEIPELRKQAYAALATIEDREALRDAAAVLNLYLQVIEDFADYANAVAALCHPHSVKSAQVPPFALHADSWIATISGLRAVAVLFVLSAFWIATAWPGGNGAAILGAVFCILFGASPAPVVVVKRVAVGFAIGQTLAFFCLFWVLPLADGFASMALAMAPFLVFVAWLIEHKRYGVEGTGVFLAMLNAMAPHNQMNYDIVSFLNDGIATFIGLGAAGVAFSSLPASASALRTRLLSALGRQTATACFAPLANGALRHHFESRTRDLLFQLNSLPAAAHGDAVDTMGQALAILEVGQIVIALRHRLEEFSQASAVRPAMQKALQAVATLCEHRSQVERHHVVTALQQVADVLDALPNLYAEDVRQRDSLLSGCYQIRAVLRDDDWLSLMRGESKRIQHPTGELHAA